MVTWVSDAQDGSGLGIFARLFSPTATPLSAELPVNSHADDDQEAPTVAGLQDGSFVVLWHGPDQDGDGDGIIGQRFSASGQKLDGEFIVNSSTSGHQRFPAATPLPDGRFAASWNSKGIAGVGAGIFLRVFSKDAIPVGGEYQLNPGNIAISYRPAIAVAASGSFLVSWTSQDADGSMEGVLARRFNPDGSPSGDAFQVNSYFQASQVRPLVLALDYGGYYVTWESFGQDGYGWGLFARRYSAGGLPLYL